MMRVTVSLSLGPCPRPMAMMTVVMTTMPMAVISVALLVLMFPVSMSVMSVVVLMMRAMTRVFLVVCRRSSVLVMSYVSVVSVLCHFDLVVWRFLKSELEGIWSAFIYLRPGQDGWRKGALSALDRRPVGSRRSRISATCLPAIFCCSITLHVGCIHYKLTFTPRTFSQLDIVLRKELS